MDRANLTQFMTIKRYRVIIKNGKKYLAVQFCNFYQEKVTGVTIRVRQFSGKQTFLGLLELSSSTIKNGSGEFNWVSKRELDDECEICEIMLQKVVYGHFAFKQLDDDIAVDYASSEDKQIDYTEFSSKLTRRKRAIRGNVNLGIIFTLIYAFVITAIAGAVIGIQLAVFPHDAPPEPPEDNPEGYVVTAAYPGGNGQNGEYILIN